MKREEKQKLAEITDFFKKAGMEEWIAQAGQAFSERYMIPGDETEDLEEALRRAPDSLLDRILETWEKEISIPGTDRGEKEKLVCELITESLEKNLTGLSEEELKLFLKVMNQYPLSYMEAAAAMEQFAPKGWAFVFLKDGECSLAVPERLRSFVLSALKDEKNKIEFGLMAVVRKSLQAALNLYGVFSKADLKRMVVESALERQRWNEEAQKTFVEENLEEKIVKNIDMLCEKEDYDFWCDGEWIVSSDFESEREYKRFLRHYGGQKTWMPSSKELFYYAENLVDRKNRFYRQLLAELTRILKDKDFADNIMFELEYKVVEDDLNYVEVMNLLTELYLSFPNAAAEERAARLSNDWIYTVKKWKNRGFSDEELGKSKPQVRILASDAVPKPPVRKKIGRNDPCPCGSGKKYKKCCGQGK